MSIRMVLHEDSVDREAKVNSEVAFSDSGKGGGPVSRTLKCVSTVLSLIVSLGKVHNHFIIIMPQAVSVFSYGTCTGRLDRTKEA